VALFTDTHLPSLYGATSWLNSEPLTPEGLRGKVVLVDFWTYTCINWLRTLGYLRAWAEKYRNDGLVVIGAHTPEFYFERELENVRWAAREMKVDYPIAVDSEYGVWEAFSNQYWPAVYIADMEGRIKYHHFGEGAYEECEEVIQELLGATGRGLVSVPDEGFEKQADLNHLQSPETYLGFERAERRDDDASKLRLNHWALMGDWAERRQGVVLNGAGGRIAFRYHARDVNLVMGPPDGGVSVPFRVLVDGEPPRDAHGLDVDGDGRGVADRQRVYQLVRQEETIDDRTFEIVFDGPGVESNVFTFG
jgi:thiol-disulfide isomerase/thioredoxin